MVKPPYPPTPEQVKSGHVVKRRQGKRPYWMAVKPPKDWKCVTKKDYDDFRGKKKKKAPAKKATPTRKKKVPAKKATPTRKKKVPAKKATPTRKKKVPAKKGINNTYLPNNKHPTITLRWVRHDNAKEFKEHFDNIGFSKNDDELIMANQGWYCLGTTDLIGYIGMVGKWRSGEHTKNTISARWFVDTGNRKGHDCLGKKWPKGLYSENKVRINKEIAKISTATVVKARPRKTGRWKNTNLPPLYNRGKRQAGFIDRIENLLIFLPAQDYRIETGKNKDRFYKKRGKSWIGGVGNPSPIAINNSKAMINQREYDSFPEGGWYSSGKFNVKCVGDVPRQLSEIFDPGINVKKLINSLDSSKLKR